MIEFLIQPFFYSQLKLFMSCIKAINFFFIVICINKSPNIVMINFNVKFFSIYFPSELSILTEKFVQNYMVIDFLCSFKYFISLVNCSFI